MAFQVPGPLINTSHVLIHIILDGGSWGTERLSNVPKSTQLVQGQPSSKPWPSPRPTL